MVDFDRGIAGKSAGASIGVGEAALTAEEIYEIDKLSALTLAAYLEKLSPEKRKLAVFLYSKDTARKMLQVIHMETKESHDRLVGIMEERGILNEGR